MKKIKKILAGGIFLAMLAALPLGIATWVTESNASQVTVQKVRISQGDKRPFSWYYPHSWEYYYPRDKVDSCYWIYTNGVYTYTCS